MQPLWTVVQSVTIRQKDGIIQTTKVIKVRVVRVDDTLWLARCAWMGNFGIVFNN